MGVFRGGASIQCHTVKQCQVEVRLQITLSENTSNQAVPLNKCSLGKLRVHSLPDVWKLSWKNTLINLYLVRSTIKCSGDLSIQTLSLVIRGFSNLSYTSCFRPSFHTKTAFRKQPSKNHKGSRSLILQPLNEVLNSFWSWSVNHSPGISGASPINHLPVITKSGHCLPLTCEKQECVLALTHRWYQEALVTSRSHTSQERYQQASACHPEWTSPCRRPWRGKWLWFSWRHVEFEACKSSFIM